VTQEQGQQKAKLVDRERRRAFRMRVNFATVVESIGAQDVPMPAALAAVYERVQPAEELIGKPMEFTLRDLSTNGAFLEGPAIPLMSRVRFQFELEGHGLVTAVGWTLWRRRATCMVPTDEGKTVELAPGVGVLFESLDLDARLEIARRTVQ
jgi:hypothetical protein